LQTQLKRASTLRMPDQVGVTVLVQSAPGDPCDFCDDTLQKLPYRACRLHYVEAAAAIQAENIPTADIDLGDLEV